jgi:hypothetical protein
MSTRRHRHRLTVLAIGALALTACFGGGDDDDENSVSVFDLEEGQCVTDLEAFQESEVEVVACDEEHAAEVFAVFDLEGDDDEPFPGEEAVTEDADEGCAEAFEDYVGTAPDESELTINSLRPSEETWENEELRDREVVCVAHLADDTLDESVEGSER